MSIKGAHARPERIAWGATVFSLLLLAATVGLRLMAPSVCLIPAATAAMLTMLMSLLAVTRANLLRRCHEEEIALRDFRLEHSSNELFEDADEALLLAKRTLNSYEKYFLPSLAIILGAVTSVVTILFWLGWNKEVLFPLAKEPLPAAALTAGCMIAALIAASYFTGVSRENGCRSLRPAGAWLYFTALVLAGCVIVFIGQHAGESPVALDPGIGKIAAALLILLGAELVIGVIIDFYRPRTRKADTRPIYESRLLSVFTEPGGIAHNVAAGLDYQFGFKVSEAWFYRFLERTLMPLFAAMLVFLWLLSCIVVVNTEEQGIRERFGRVTSREALNPGIYLKMPAPFARIYKFPVERVQVVPVGYSNEEGDKQPAEEEMDEELVGDMTARVIIWSKKHYQHENSFVVPGDTQEEQSLLPASPDDMQAPISAYFLTAAMPVYFKVNNLYAYAYKHKDPQTILKNLASREIVRFFANVDFFQILSRERALGREILREKIQESVDNVGLGVEIVFVGLQGLHPPVNVGAAYDEVVGAMEEKYTEGLMAERDSIKSRIESEGEAAEKIAQAKGYRETRLKVAGAEAGRFEKQLLAHNAAPRIFTLRSYLDVIENEGAKLRKYVIATQNSHEVIILNLEDKFRPDLLDLDIDNVDLY